MSSVSEHTSSQDFHGLLEREFLEKKQRNSRYSLRAYARFLDLEPSYLSKILKGRRQITPKLIDRLSPKLQISSETAKEMKTKVHQMKALRSGQANTPSKKFKELSEEQFTPISDWYHFAILELTYLPDFQEDETRIGKQLSIPPSLAKRALEQLERTKLLKRDENHNLVCSGSNTTTTNTFSAEPFRNLQRGLLNKAIYALDFVPFDKRDHSSYTLAIDESMIPLAKSMIKNFRRTLASTLEQSSEKNAVYNLNIAFFPLSGEY